MSMVPALVEIAAVTPLAHWLLGLTWLESAILGSILGAVSPAVVVPLMIDFMERGKGSDKGIPTLVLAASSLDDVFVIVIFTVLLGMYGGAELSITWQVMGIPISVVLGVVAGLIPGYLLYRLFNRFDLRPPRKTLIVLGAAIGLTWLEGVLHGVVPMAGLIGVMAIGFIMLEKAEGLAHQISAKLKQLWVFAELLLFVLVGAQVDLTVAWQAGAAGVLVILGGLVARSLGTYLALAGCGLTPAEKWFATVAYLPKATVQAAIGATPLAAGVAGGEVILAVAVMSIVLTAPLGAVLIKIVGERVLSEDERPAYNFKELREKLGLPRVGQRVSSQGGNEIWKVIEERETWRDPEQGRPQPLIQLRLWRADMDLPPGQGPTRWLTFDGDAPAFTRDWNIVYQ
jgi:NhaP-type Na+/H+ or K+/H+ antiporter